jgi:amidase
MGPGSQPGDAFIIKRLKAAGAIVLAKANLSEWANFRSSPSSSGWSGIGGQNNSPYVLDRNPCGSSSGSAVAVAADLAVASVGTETDGSIVCPAGTNSLVGIKPTLGLLSRAGVVPISANQDTAGPIARNVTDAAVLLGALTGVDRADQATTAQRGHALHNYTQFLDPAALDGARIGVWREGGGFGVDSNVDAIMERSIQALEDAGAVIIDPVAVPIDEAYGPEFEALLCEFKTDLRTYLQTYTAPQHPKSLQDLLDFNDTHPDLEGPWNSDIFVAAQATNGRDADCLLARHRADSIARDALDAALADNNLDAIIAPTNNPATLTDPVNGDDFSAYVSSSTPAAITGYASITVPAGYVDKQLPVGMSFIAGAWDEPMLIGLAYAFEQATHVRKRPQFLPTLN